MALLTTLKPRLRVARVECPIDFHSTLIPTSGGRTMPLLRGLPLSLAREAVSRSHDTETSHPCLSQPSSPNPFPIHLYTTIIRTEKILSLP